MKRIVDIFSKDWSHEILWTYVIELSNGPNQGIDAYENEALRLALEDNKGDMASIFAKVRE
ncbi:hypothetical protein [Polynucleobacter sp. AP-Nickl1-40-C4]|uniref:hypothetical protein n=1 Tax=Polynucleobacter sp. AP-Nickl1-40-C4 TaxID=3108275 RepID=UPI002B22F492|nr:hypothetical protein [Polynucleobacter sp. AP-Nickl1-40-C4]MEA9569112.1 hypothetical protein [Polynucleobacter sp. AP-Nickl1-40-C4]